MKSKRRTLEEAVVEAARGCVTYDCVTHTLVVAVQALDEHLLAVDGRGAPWAEGSDTSRQAAKLAWPTQNSTRLAILALVANVGALSAPGYTDRQLENRLSRSHQTVSSARNWLVEAGWLRDSGERRSTNGRPATVWRLTDAAVRAFTEGRP